MSAPYRNWLAVSDDYLAQKLAERLLDTSSITLSSAAGTAPTCQTGGVTTPFCSCGGWCGNVCATWLRKSRPVIGERSGILLSYRKIKRVEGLLRSERALIADPNEWQATTSGLVPR